MNVSVEVRECECVGARVQVWQEREFRYESVSVYGDCAIVRVWVWVQLCECEYVSVSVSMGMRLSLVQYYESVSANANMMM